MKTGRKLTTKTVLQAQADLEAAARQLVNRAEWANPYSMAGRRYRAPVNELRLPLAELRLARRMAK